MERCLKPELLDELPRDDPSAVQSRRDLLRVNAWMGNAPPFFTEVPPAVSGIHWAHVAGLSSNMYVPETIGPGGAFLDYDNDGWMDIYLVNSGPCDFYTPPQPLRNALYRNNRDGTFTDVTEKAGVPGNAYGDRK